MVNLVVVDRDRDCTVVTEQLAQQHQPWQHHAAPLVVAGEVVAVRLSRPTVLPSQSCIIGELTLSL